MARIGKEREFLFGFQLSHLRLEVRGIALKIVDGLLVDEAVRKVTRCFGLDPKRPNLFEVHSIIHDHTTRMNCASDSKKVQRQRPSLESQNATACQGFPERRMFALNSL